MQPKKIIIITGSLGVILILFAHFARDSLAYEQTDVADESSLHLFLPNQPFNYANIDLPPYFTTPPIVNADNTPPGNPVTDAGATLGRVLFYDRNLSANQTISCASCHEQENGFADDSRFSRGFEGGLTGRNSPGLANGRYYQNGHFFWDERAGTLEEQVLIPIQDDVEMGLTLAELESRVAAQPYYADLFTDAFGSPDVTSERISLALAQFVRSMLSYQSKYDAGLAQNFTNFTPQENLGRQLFFSPQTNCAACHGTAIMIANQARNIGLDAVYEDTGLGGVTGNPADVGKFKVPSLRNIAVTGPYMHDGRFETLAEVVRFYNRDIQAHPNLDPLLQNNEGQPRRLRLNRTEREALVAFLNTLTDASFLTDPKFGDPFVEEIFASYLPLLID